MKRFVLVLGCVTIVLCLFIAGCSAPPQISDIKSEKWRSFIGKEMTLEGYFVDRPVPMLITSMELLLINSPIPQENYIRLTGKPIEGLDPEKFYGAYVKISGTVGVSKGERIKIMQEKFGDMYAMEFTCGTEPVILEPKPAQLLIPEFVRYPPGTFVPIDTIRFSLRDRYAILISGGINSDNAHSRYWNDLKFMYLTLTGTYNFPADNVIVVYKDGTAEDTDMPVDYAATSPNVTQAFGDIINNIDKRDLFVLFTTNHGGGFNMENANARNWDGVLDNNIDETDEAIFEEHLNTDLNNDGDQDDQIRFDEILFMYDTTIDVWDDHLRTHLDSLNCDTKVVIMEQCFSGGFLADLRGPKRVIISACSEYEFSWGGGPGDHDVFCYHFISALNGATHDGTQVDADDDNNGKISMVEAFEYARINDTAGETPWYEDSGDGRGHPGPLPQDGDGEFGKNVYFE